MSRYVGLLIEEDLEFERIPGTDKVLIRNAVEGRALCIRIHHLMRAQVEMRRVVTEFFNDAKLPKGNVIPLHATPPKRSS